jgi:hypothetical protein
VPTRLLEEAERALTKADSDERKMELLQDASTFAKCILEIVRRGRRGVTDEDLKDTTLEDIDLNEDSEEAQLPRQEEDDVEERDMQPGGLGAVPVNEATPEHDQTINGKLSYLDIVQTLMDVILSNTLGDYTSNERINCSLCFDDPTILEDRITNATRIITRCI